MHRALAASLALWLMPHGGLAQNFQFMPFEERAMATVLPQGITGSGVSGDVTGDGRDDILLSDTSTRVVRRSDSGWVSMGTLPGSSRSQPVLADLDGDGDLDLVCVPHSLPTAGPVALFRNMVPPLAWFTPIAHPLGTTAVQAAAVGDVDGNGFPDVVVATETGSALPALVLLRGGPGLQFTLDTTSMPAGLPHALWLTLLDADGDGDLDVLASNATSGLLLLRNVAGTFVDASASLPPARLGHVALESGDFDSDGHGDCLCALGNGDVDMLWGGPGAFTFAAAVATGLPMQRCWPADFDGDGDLDVLVHGLASLDVLWNQGNRRFVRSNGHGAATTLRLVADADEDGLPDILFAAPGSGTRCLYAGCCADAANVVRMLPPPGGANASPPTPADVDGDGHTDLLYVGTNMTGVNQRLGGGTWRSSSAPVALTGTGAMWDVEVAHMDGDSHLDVVVETDSTLNVLTNTGTGTFTSALQRSVTSSGGTVDGLRVGDIDGDGDPDIVQAESRGLVLTRNQGGGQYAPPAVLAAGTANCVDVADFDGDGDLDVVGNPGAGHIVVNLGAGVFAPSVSFNLGNASAIRAADFNGDGLPDLAVTDTTRLRILRNNGNLTFTDRSQLDLPSLPILFLSNLVTADFDEDGDIDIGAVAFGWLLLVNDGTGRFSDRTAARMSPASTNGFDTWQLRAADIDDDGDLDWIAGWNASTVVLGNHLRHCYSRAVPRLGGVIEASLFSGPFFGTQGLGLLGIGFALAPRPQPLPLVQGKLELDLAALWIPAVVPTSSVGLSSVFVPVPLDSALAGIEFWLQCGILPSVGPPGFTNAVYEQILR